MLNKARVTLWPRRCCVRAAGFRPDSRPVPRLGTCSVLRGSKSTACNSHAGRGAAPKPRPPAVKPPTTTKQVAKPPAEQKDSRFLIVGLGNPGNNYERTRHNVGFMVVDELARLEGIDCKSLEKSAVVGKGEVCGRQVLLVKPMTFMNNSGESVSSLAKFYKILVISDDLEQPTANVKLMAKGGHGGHNGLRSIMERMGNSQDFPRIKIGIGRPAGQLPVAAYVIQDFSKKEAEIIAVAIQESVDCIRNVLALGCEAALARTKTSPNR